MSGSDFRDLVVWQKAKKLAITIYRLSSEGELARDFAMRDQMRRACVSVCSNIAEGNERGTDRDTVRFLRVAKGSAAELIAQLEIAEAVGLIESERARAALADVDEIARMLGGLIKARERFIQ